MFYEIVIAPAAERDLKKLDRPTLRRIVAKIQSLSQVPRPPGVKKLEARLNLYRLRVGPHGVIYQIQDDKLVVLIVRVRKRGEAYR